MTILERMADAKAKMTAQEGSRWTRRQRVPKVFYLNERDFAEFVATDPPKIEAVFRNAPSCEYGFDELPVRAAKGLNVVSPSRLYSEAGTSRSLALA